MQKASFLITLAVLTATACKKDDDKETSLIQDSFNNQSYYLVEPGNLERGPSQLLGTGAVVMAAPLNSILSQDNFGLEFTLAEGGSLALITHSTNGLQQGLTVQFDRAGTELSTSIKADGSGTSDHVLEGIDASGTITLAVDVHNNETPAHVLIWNAAAGSYDEEAALYNSERDEEAPGQGQANLWGLVLRNADLKAVTLDAAKFSDE